MCILESCGPRESENFVFWVALLELRGKISVRLWRSRPGGTSLGPPVISLVWLFKSPGPRQYVIQFAELPA